MTIAPPARLAAACTTALAGLLAGCATTAPEAPLPSADALKAACPALQGLALPANAIGLPSGPVSITSATFVPAAPAREAGGALQPATPDHCRVLGRIAPRTASAQPILFLLNLPLAWNGKALQYGGGGLNGVLITGMAPLRDAAPDDALPITRGYATYGTDSGHQASASPPSEPGAFLLDDEMFENFAHAAYKKVRDAAVAIQRAYYGRAPQRVYYFGGSEGGREGLAMAQRYPADYDGIVSVVPVVGWTGLFHAFVRHEVPQFTDWLQAGKVPLIARATSQACDALDGLADGVVNNYLACQPRVDLKPLRCAGGADTGLDCLSDGELALLGSMHTPYVFPFPLANGRTTYPAWLWGHEDALDGPSAQSLVRWVTGTAAPTVPPNPATAATQWLYGSNWIRYAIARDAAFDVRKYDPRRFQARVQQTSGWMDATSPDLSTFFARGGKIIVRENAADRAQSAAMGFEYVDSVIARLGRSAVDASLRLYVSPASTHTGNSRSVGDARALPTMVDLLDPLDRWVSTGTPPPDALVQTVKAPLPPHALQASRPMCRYPLYPHHTGGDRLQAASYTCRASAP